MFMERRLNSIKMSIFQKLIYKVNKILNNFKKCFLWNFIKIIINVYDKWRVKHSQDTSKEEHISN